MKRTSRREFLQFAAAALMAPRVQATVPEITTLLDKATVDNPFHMMMGPDSFLYFSDYGTNRVLKYDFRMKQVSVVAGTGTKGHAGDGGPATSAQLAAPHEVRFDSKGNLYIDERDNHTIRKVDMKTGVITTVAGTPRKNGYGGDGGPATTALLNQPHGIVLDRQDNLYICDPLNNRVRCVDAKTGLISTFAGNGQAGHTPDEGGLTEVPLAGPRSLEIARDGKWYLALREGNGIFLLDPARRAVKRIAGTGENGYSGDGGPAIGARFGSLGAGGLTGPKGLCVSDDGRIMFVADCENHVIRRIDLRTGIISTVAGTGERADGPDGDPLKCKLSRPHAVLLRGRTLYIADSENNRIRLLQPAI
jgi:sugar lactone lactonase YvrE